MWSSCSKTQSSQANQITYYLSTQCTISASPSNVEISELSFECLHCHWTQDIIKCVYSAFHCIFYSCLTRENLIITFGKDFYASREKKKKSRLDSRNFLQQASETRVDLWCSAVRQRLGLALLKSLSLLWHFCPTGGALTSYLCCTRAASSTWVTHIFLLKYLPLE